MSDANFNAELDALVVGEAVASTDDLIRFATDLYRKEGTVTMPGALKHQIASQLGLAVADSHGNAPISNRSRRAAAAARPLPAKSWPVAFTVMLVVALAFTGLLQLALRPDDTDRFGGFSPAVPTAQLISGRDDTPTIAAWMNPITAEECPRGELQEVGVQVNPLATWYSENDYDALPEAVVYGPFRQANMADADAVVTRMREITACELAIVPNHALQISSPRFEYETRTSAGRVAFARRNDQRLQAAMDLSRFYQDELHLTPATLMIHHPNPTLAEGSFLPDGMNSFYNPAHVVQLADGRVVVLMSMVGFGDDFPYDIAAERTYAPTVLIFTEIDEQWYLDERLQVCIGDCDGFWVEQEFVTPSATPVSTSANETLPSLTVTPIASAVAQLDWIRPISPLDCTIDSGALDQSVGVVELDYSAQPERVDAPYGVPDDVTRNELTDRVREVRACLNSVGINAFWTDRLSFEMNDRSFTTSETGALFKADQIIRGRALSDYYMTNLGVTREAYVMHFQFGEPQVVGVQPGVHTVLNPDWIVQLEDGRVVVLLSAVVVATEDGVFLTDPGDVVAAGGAWVLTQVDGEWLIDELLPVCFGNATECDEFWSMLPGANMLATPIASPIATPSD